MFLYQTITKESYMPNINAFCPMVRKEQIFNGFYFVNLHKTMSP